MQEVPAAMPVVLNSPFESEPCGHGVVHTPPVDGVPLSAGKRGTLVVPKHTETEPLDPALACWVNVMTTCAVLVPQGEIPDLV